ncbi:MAG: hypothetical protein CSB23_05095 [Deltaproteobacteria bacterium]|nr:MAG: hypothetical protein CSB23_05095 [Deltaproteobacteria bacterium]
MPSSTAERFACSSASAFDVPIPSAMTVLSPEKLEKAGVWENKKEKKNNKNKRFLMDYSGCYKVSKF